MSPCPAAFTGAASMPTNATVSPDGPGSFAIKVKFRFQTYKKKKILYDLLLQRYAERGATKRRDTATFLENASRKKGSIFYWSLQM